MEVFMPVMLSRPLGRVETSQKSSLIRHSDQGSVATAVEESQKANCILLDPSTSLRMTIKRVV